MKTAPLRVLMTADTLGGVWTYAMDLMRAMEPHGVEFLLATMGGPLSASQRDELSLIKNAELRASRFALEWMDEPWADVDAAGDWLLKLAAEFQPDVVHLNGYAHAALPWPAPVVVVAHSCVCSWWRAVKGGPAPACYDAYRERVSAGLNAANRVVAPTAAMLADLHRCYSFHATGDVIPNGRARGIFRPREKKPQIFSAGRLWDEAKNVAALESCGTRVRWPIRVAGDRRHPNGTVASLKDVHCLDTLSPGELARELGESAIYALPARYEPFGLSVLEAALSGCALVVGDLPSLREIWGDATLYVPHQVPGALADALNRLIEDEPVRAALSARAFERAQLFSPERMAAGYNAVYRALAGKRREPQALVAA